jgi:hypothetical protein
MKVWDYKSNENDALSKLVEKNPDIVMTNPEMAKYLLSRIKFEDNDILLEPCKGSGAFYNNFPDNTINKYCEINEGLDFFDFNEKVDYIISNPPFVPRKLFWNFMIKSMNICRKKIYWLINLSALNVFTPKRLDEMEELDWYIQSFHIVADKRWFGRYCFLEISKEPSNVFTCLNRTF